MAEGEGDLTKRQKCDIILSETEEQYKMNVCFDERRKEASYE